MSKLTAMEQLDQIKRCLVPKGTVDLVGLRLHSACYVNSDFIKELIDELEKLPMMVAMGEQVSPMQRLAIMVLKDSAWIED